MPAAGQAEVVARDLQPLVLGRSGKHPLQQLVVALLQLVALAQPGLRLADPLRQRVADRLQVPQAEHARQRRHSGDLGLDPLPLEALGEQPRQLPFETADLPPQLRPRQPLVAARAKRDPAVSVEQIRHTHHQA